MNVHVHTLQCINLNKHNTCILLKIKIKVTHGDHAGIHAHQKTHHHRSRSNSKHDCVSKSAWLTAFKHFLAIPRVTHLSVRYSVCTWSRHCQYVIMQVAVEMTSFDIIYTHVRTEPPVSVECWICMKMKSWSWQSHIIFIFLLFLINIIHT